MRNGAGMVFITDRYPNRDTLPAHALLAIGAIHAHLIETGLRCQCNLLVETATARDAHQFACLIGFGATAVYPWLAYQSLFDLGRDGHIKRGDGDGARDRPQLSPRHPQGPAEDPVEDGHLHRSPAIAARSCSRSSAWHREVVTLCFAGTPSRIGGAGFADLEHEHAPARRRGAANEAQPLRAGGMLQVRARRRIPHVQPGRGRHAAARGAQRRRWPTIAAMREHVDARPPSALRDLLLPQRGRCADSAR